MTKTFIDQEPFAAALNAMVTARKRIISVSIYSPEAKQRAEIELNVINQVRSMANDNRYLKEISL